jgi:predicted transcriptional regulator
VTFSIYIDDDLVEHLNRIAGETGKPRNALVREALQEWLARRKRSRWPATVMAFRGIKGLPRFEEGRETLQEPRDPFGEVSS